MSDLSIVSSQPTSYDDVPYPSTAYRGTHPDRLATLAVMSGMTPPAVTKCRVLEMACSDGGNVIPMAYALPESEFVGIDSSQEEVARGRREVERFGLGNVRLQHMDILDVSPKMGEFDYIVAYGVYSWVRPEVQDKILEICGALLAPNGVAYVSYNTLPGWYLFNVMRDLLLYHARGESDAEARIHRARDLLRFLGDREQETVDLYGALLQHITHMLEPLSDSYIYHDFMEQTNEPVYFHEFVRRAGRHGLQFMANAETSRQRQRNLPDDLMAKVLTLTKDPIAIEQYSDFLLNSTFRQTALVHATVDLDRTITPDCLDRLRISSQVRPVEPDLDPATDQPAEFVTPDEKSALSVPHPLTKAALLHLNETWPHTTPLDELIAAAHSGIAAGNDSSPAATDVRLLKSNLLQAYSQGSSLVELHTYSPRLTTDVTARPQASAIARDQATAEKNNVVNMRHQFVGIDEVNRRLLCLLDGEHDHAALLDALRMWHAEGWIDITDENEEAVTDSARIELVLAEVLQQRLVRLGQVGLLVG